jgi:hypothetical protein
MFFISVVKSIETPKEESRFPPHPPSLSTKPSNQLGENYDDEGMNFLIIGYCS